MLKNIWQSHFWGHEAKGARWVKNRELCLKEMSASFDLNNLKNSSPIFFKINLNQSISHDD